MTSPRPSPPRRPPRPRPWRRAAARALAQGTVLSLALGALQAPADPTSAPVEGGAPAAHATAPPGHPEGPGRVARMGAAGGEMTVEAGAVTEAAPREGLVFEPWQMLDDLGRADIVLLMRHGPTDWSRRDADGVGATDCANQRLLSAEGRARMRDLGVLLAGNGVRPARVVVSQWCRGQETLAALREGFALVDPAYAAGLDARTDPGANLLLSLGGAATVTPLRATISGWPEEARRAGGPLLVVTHFTNIAELTEFNVYEGEMLVLDPRLDNRVLGYLRLRSAGPDVGHFGAMGRPE